MRRALARRRRRQPTAGPAAVPSHPLPHAQHPPAPLPGSSAGGEAAPSKTHVPVADSALAQPLLGPEDPEEQQPGAAVAAVPPARAAPMQPDQEGTTPGTKPELARPRMATSPPGPSSPAAGGGAQAEQAAQPGWRRQAAVLAGTTFFLSSLLLAQVFSLLFTTVGALAAHRGGCTATWRPAQRARAPAACTPPPSCKPAGGTHGLQPASSCLPGRLASQALAAVPAAVSAQHS